MEASDFEIDCVSYGAWVQCVSGYVMYTCTSNETHSHGKRDLLIWQKRPAHIAKVTCSYGKRDPLIWQKRPTHIAKETCSYGKRDLLNLKMEALDFEIDCVSCQIFICSCIHILMYSHINIFIYSYIHIFIYSHICSLVGVEDGVTYLCIHTHMQSCGGGGWSDLAAR